LRALRRLFHIDDTPHRTALAFGVGLFIAFFPIFGVHTVLALGIAFLFKLNRVATLVGAFVNNPWTFAPMYLGGTVAGCILLGIPFDDLSTATFEQGLADGLLERLAPFLWPYLLGNLVLGTLAGGLGYYLVRRALERRRRKTPQPA
jgi:hypothetical protein